MVLDKEEDGCGIPASRYAFSVNPIFGSTDFLMNAISTGRIFRPVGRYWRPTEISTGNKIRPVGKLDAVLFFYIYHFRFFMYNQTKIAVRISANGYNV